MNENPDTIDATSTPPAGDAEIARLLELDKAATPGPWAARSGYVWNDERKVEVASCSTMFGPDEEEQDINNGRFIALCRTLAPRLVADLAAAREALEAADHALDKAHSLDILGFNLRHSDGNSPDESGIEHDSYARHIGRTHATITNARKRIRETLSGISVIPRPLSATGIPMESHGTPTDKNDPEA